MIFSDFMIYAQERRHQADMLQTFKILRGIDRVDHKTWFQLAAETGRATRSADDPLNLRLKASRLEVRRHFSPTESWRNGTLYQAQWKMPEQWAHSRKPRKNSELKWWLPHSWRRCWSQDGGVENNRMQTLPQRSQRDHWKFLYKNKNRYLVSRSK